MQCHFWDTWTWSLLLQLCLLFTEIPRASLCSGFLHLSDRWSQSLLSVLTGYGLCGSSLDWRNPSPCTAVSFKRWWHAPCMFCLLGLSQCQRCSWQVPNVLLVKLMGIGPAELLLSLTGHELSIPNPPDHILLPEDSDPFLPRPTLS